VGRRAARRWRLFRRVLVVVAGGFILLLAGGLAMMLPARTSLEEARNALQDGRDALASGDASGARERFAAGKQAFEEAGSRLANPLTRAVSVLPIIGRTPDAAIGIAEAGTLVARAGAVLAAGLHALPGGPRALAPEDGTLPLEPIRRLTRPLDEAAALVGTADRTASRTPGTWVLPPVSGALSTFNREVGTLRETLEAAAGLARHLPPFLGEGGTRRYFFGAQNPAELRGTGGLLGAYTVMTVREGHLRMGRFNDTSTLSDVKEIPAPNEDYARLYDQYGGAGFWKNINMTPDFPSAAAAIERLYEEVEGVALDGAILADPQALSFLMEVTGPVRDPRTGRLLEAGDVVPFLTNEAYSVYTETAERKRILGALAGTILDRYLSGDWEDPYAAVDALVRAVGGGHILLHSGEAGVQEALERAGVAGRLLPPSGDHLAVVVNNAGGNKMDFYARRTVRYEIRLLPGGEGAASFEARYLNEGPSDGQPAYVIGPFPGVSNAGENVMIAGTYCGSCRLYAARHDGEATKVALEEELGHAVVINTVRITSGASARLSYDWTVPAAWSPDGAGGTYQLTFQGQPTIRPTRLEVVVVAPAGTVITEATPGMVVEDGQASWRGAPGELLTLDVRFATPLAIRLLLPVGPWAQ
jgi:hypothetical protein